MDKTIGYIVKTLRIKKNFTHSDLAKKSSLTREQIVKIEAGKFSPSEEILTSLSDLFKFDIETVLGCKENFKSEDSFDCYVDLKLAIYNFDVRELEELIETSKNFDEFNEGQLKQIVSHAKGLIAIHAKKDFEGAIEICKEGIEEFYELDYDFLEKNRLTDHTYLLLISLATSIEALGDIEHCKQITDVTLHSIQRFLFSDGIILDRNKHMLEKAYVISINNAAHCNFELQDYNSTLEVIEEGIAKCMEFEIHTVLTYFQHLKFESYYCLGQFKEAQENYDLLKTLSAITSNGQLLVRALRKIKAKYPKIQK